MKLLLDQNISNRVVNKLIEHFPEIKHVKHFGLSDSNDSQIWRYAKENNYSIVTFDSDFYDMLLVYGFPPKIIWLRTGNIKTDALSGILINNKQRIYSFITRPENEETGCIEIVS